MSSAGFNWAMWHRTKAGKAKKKQLAKEKKIREKAKAKEKAENKRLKAEAFEKLKASRMPFYDIFRFTIRKATLSQRIAIGAIDYTFGKRYTDACFYKHLKSPEVMYELKDRTIIRTVSAFHYMSKFTERNGICNSFRMLTHRYVKKDMPIGGKVFNVHDAIIDEFCKRYTVGMVKKVNTSKSDLDMTLSIHRIKINRGYYFIVSVQNENGEWNPPRLFVASDVRRLTINPETPLKMTQEEIIEKLKSGEIQSVTKYGEKDVVYTNKEVLKMLKIK